MSLLKDFDLGTRIVVRYRIAGPLPLSDALGILISRSAEEIAVETKRGTVVIPCSEIVATKRVPPPPARRR